MSQETIAFIQRHAQEVIKSVQGTTFFPSVKMAQMIIESSGKDENGKFGIGKGMAVRKANNYFGIKADKRWKGKTVQLNTPKDGKPVSLFRVYASALDSLKDHTQFVLQNARYKNHGVFSAKAPQAQAQALQKAGYSESATYGKALSALIKAYQLEQLDGKKAEAEAEPVTPIFLIGGSLLLLAGAVYYRKDIGNSLQKMISS